MRMNRFVIAPPTSKTTSRTISILSIFLLALSVFHSSAQAKPSPRRAASSEFSVADVIKLTKAGVSEDIIIQHIKKKAHPFDLSTDQLIALKNANVSDRVVQVMIDPSKADAPASNVGAVVSVPTLASDGSLPTEPGAYVKKQEKWTEVLPEVVYFKSGGKFKTIASVGISRGDGGRVLGVTSRNAYELPLEILVVMPENAAMAEYALLHLSKDSNNRNFRGGTHDIIPFEPKRISPRIFTLTFPSTAGPGEYGMLPPNASGKSGKIYSFRIGN